MTEGSPADKNLIALTNRPILLNIKKTGNVREKKVTWRDVRANIFAGEKEQ